MADTHVITSKKGKEILVHEGRLYHYHSKSKNGTRCYWRCVKRDICNARCVTNANIQGEIHVYKAGRHEHETLPPEIEVREIVAGIKRRAQNHPNEPPLAIIREELQNVENEATQALLPERQAVLRMVNRQQNRNHPVIPRTLQECSILEPYDKTVLGEQFLRYDSGVGDNNRILIFTTNDLLRHLSRSNIILGDGTFKSVPSMFYQMYTLHGLVFGHVFPLVYCLLVRKDEETYNRMYQEVINLCTAAEINLNPTTVLTDFELSAMNAGRQNFPNAEIKGCLFHFCRCV